MRHPRGLYVLFFTEMWERFSYYGMRALLMLYMVQALGMNVPAAGRIYGLYTASVYLTPLVGGYLADRVLGAHRAVVWGAALMALGHFAMVLTPLPCFYLALTLLVVGCGLFKPNLSVLVGELYHADDPRRDAAFGLFYMGINLGAFLSPLICGTLGQTLGWHWGFGSAGVGMLLGLIIFVRGRHLVTPASLAAQVPSAAAATAPDAAAVVAAVATPSAAPPASGQDAFVTQPSPMVSLTTSCIARETADGRPSAADALAVAREQPPRTVVLQRLGVLAALAVFGNVIFWSAYEQAGSSLAIFADRYCDLHLFGGAWAMPSSWYQAFNPLFIIVLTPLLGLLWGALHSWRREPSTPMKFVVGLAFLCLGFFIVRLAGAHVDAGEQVSLGWLVAAAFVNTCAELCISPVGLSAVTRLSPPRFGSLVMGAWLASIALANYGSGELASHFGQVPHALFFTIPMTLAGLAAAFLWLLTPTLRRMMHGVH